MSVDAKSRKTFLRMSCQYCCQIYGSRTFCSVESPYGFGPMRVHVHCFGTIAPATGYGDGGSYAFAFKFLGTGGAFAYTSDGAVGNDTFHGTAVTILQVSRNQFGNSFCQIHSLFFKAFTNTALAAVDSGTNPDFRILFHDIVDNKFLTICFLFLFFCYKECLMCTSVGRYSFISLPDRTKSAASFPICSQSILMEVMP